MKITLIVLLVIAALFILLQAYLTMSINKTETQPYTVIRKEKAFEIRFYPSAIMATILSSARSYKQLGSSGFSKLAGYIFGGNQANQQIAMTSPVHMAVHDSNSTMSFVMPAGYQTQDLPQPNDPGVKIETTPDEYAAVISYGGFSSDSDIQTYSAKLAKLLEAQGIEHDGNFRYLGYNPPYQLFGRKNEILVGVKWEAR
jgi:hypothetical protein